MSKPKPAPLPSGTVVGGYQVIKKLAAGDCAREELNRIAEQTFLFVRDVLLGINMVTAPGKTLKSLD